MGQDSQTVAWLIAQKERLGEWLPWGHKEGAFSLSFFIQGPVIGDKPEETHWMAVQAHAQERDSFCSTEVVRVCVQVVIIV